MAKESIISGTKEWAVANKNCVTGCSNGCLYCYERERTCFRLKRFPASEWTTERVRDHDVRAGHKQVYNGRVMFPTSHDISPDTVDACLIVIKKVLAAGNQMLICSKPRLSVIKRLCDELKDFKKQILFRFTIGARNPKILSHWEPGASTYEERKMALAFAKNCGFETSVSMEPMLDTSDAVEIFRDLEHFVSDTIWLGKMNKPNQRVRCETEEDRKQLQLIIDVQDDDSIKAIHLPYAQERTQSSVEGKHQADCGDSIGNRGWNGQITRPGRGNWL